MGCEPYELLRRKEITMGPRKNERKEKISYEKPELKVIELVADEVLGIGCKMDGQSAGVPDGNPCAITSCSSEGS